MQSRMRNAAMILPAAIQALQARQRRPVLDYLVAVRTAHLHGEPLPTIIPS
jgi:hypothetical protein